MKPLIQRLIDKTVPDCDSAKPVKIGGVEIQAPVCGEGKHMIDQLNTLENLFKPKELQQG